MKAKAISLYQPVSIKEVELSQALDMFCHNTHKNGQNDTGNSKPMEKQIHVALPEIAVQSSLDPIFQSQQIFF